MKLPEGMPESYLRQTGMDYECIWIMRQIEGMTDMLGKVLLHREKSEIRVEEELSDEDVKKYHRRIQALLRERKYPEAVQYLREYFATGSMEYLKVALSAFDQLNSLSESELQEGGYTRQELYNDLEFITQQYGIHL